MGSGKRILFIFYFYIHTSAVCFLQFNIYISSKKIKVTCTCRRTEEGILLAGPKQQKDAIAAGIDDFLPGQSGRHHHHKVRPARLKKCSNKFLKIVQFVRKNQRKFFFP